MGKKSLFEPTVAPEEKKKAPAPAAEEKVTKNKAETSVKQHPETEARPVKKSERAPTREAEVPARKTDASQKEPAFEADISGAETEVPPFENDPLIDTRQLLLGVACLCGLIFIMLIASMINTGNYYINQNRGAVEIWKGDFTPAGKDRILILHGTHWDRKVKSSYSIEEAFSFAAGYYLEKAKSLTEAPSPDDFDRIAYYLDRVRELFVNIESEAVDTRINQVEKYMTESRILQASGEKAAVDLAKVKNKSAGEALADLIADMAGDSPKAENGASGH